MVSGTLSISVVAIGLTIGMPAVAERNEILRVANDQVMAANYPRGALKRGEQGVVGANLRIDAQGRVRDCTVTKSSGFYDLDDATCDFLIDHMKSKPYVAPNGGGRVRRHDALVTWTLPQGYAVGTGVPGAKRAALPSQKICHVQATTGSLVLSQRICLTKAEWLLQTELAQEALQDMKPKAQSGQ